MRRAGDVAVAKNGWLLVFLILSFFSGRAVSQELPADELQLNLSGYFDSFDVNVTYPSIALTGKVSETTSLTGRYLVDMITAASIHGGGSVLRSGENETEDDERGERDFDKLAKAGGPKQVDAITAASVGTGGVGGSGGREGPSFDDVRHEFNLGVTQLLAGSQVMLNGIYSTERDYTSSTLAGKISRAFALKNTVLELGFVHSWDHVFPVTKDWTRDKNVITYSLNISQILSQWALIQFLTSYMENNGYLADAYQQVPVGPAENAVLYDPVHPQKRVRRAAGTNLKFRLNSSSSLETGYRYYWDSWDVISHTISANFMTYLSQHVIFDLGWRHYLQSRAYFFKSEYLQPEPLMTVDVKLDDLYSDELQLGLTLRGGKGQDYLPFLTSEKVQYHLGLNIYHRHTQTGYWYNGEKNLLAANFNIGLRVQL